MKKGQNQAANYSKGGNNNFGVGSHAFFQNGGTSGNPSTQAGSNNILQLKQVKNGNSEKPQGRDSFSMNNQSK